MIFIRDVKTFQGLYISFFILICIFYAVLSVSSTPQQPDLNDQYENTTLIENIITPNETHETIIPSNITLEKKEVSPRNITESKTELIHPIVEESIFTRLKDMITKPIIRIISIPKIKLVLKNVGTCMVNGAMDLVTYYFPTPLIPLIATAAGMIIPFEPVVMLREKMPVTSYRRAFKSALDGFLGTFDRYKLEDEENSDPYMTRRFNRRLMNDSGEKNKIDKK